MAVTDGYSPRPDFDRLREVDPDRVVVSYDRASDTLMVHFYGRGRPAVSVPSPQPVARDFVFLRFDPETDELVGVQIEDFLDLYVPQHPESLDWLGRRPELRGITREEIARLRDRLGGGQRSPATVQSLIEELALAG